MKKILLLLSLILCYAVSYSQYPLTQNLANDSTLVHAKGALKSRLIVYNFTDTTAANQQRISQYSGAIIFTTSNNKLWVRNSTTSAWKDIQNATVNWGSIGGSLNDQTDLKDSLFLRLRISDTTLMLSNYINGVGYGIIKNGKVVSIDSATLSSYYLRKKDSVSGGYYPYESNPLQYITSSSIPQQGNHVINGLVVSYVSGLTFYVSAGNYYMNNKLYYFGGGSVTLAAADPSNDRQDLIIVDTLETLSSLTGTPAVNPSVPTEDPASQLGLTSVYIPAGATTPSGVSQTIIYDENAVGEWTISKNWTSTDNYATNPYHGSVSSRVTSASSNQYILFTASADKSKMNYGNLVFYVRNNSTVPGSTSFNVALFNNGNNVSNSVQLTTYGYSNSITGSYQIIAIPISAFTGTDAFDAVRIQKKGFVNTLDVQFDYIQLQGGIIQSGGGTQNTITGINGNTGNYTAAAPNSTVNIVGTNGVSTSVSGSTVTIDGIGTRSNLSATAPITYNSGTGVLGADTSTGATHLATQNYVNLFFNSNIPSLQQVTTIGHITNDSVQSYKGFVVNNGSSIASMVPNGLGGGIIFLKENSTIRGAYIEPIDGLTTSRILYLPDATDTLANRQWVRSLVSGGGGGSLSSLSDVNISSPANLQLLQYQTGDSKWHNWTPNYLSSVDTSNISNFYLKVRSLFSTAAGSGAYNSSTGLITIPTNTNQLTNGAGFITGNQSITLSGDVSGTGSTAITTAIGAGKVTNAMLAGSIDTSKITSFYARVRSELSATSPITYSSGTGVFGITQANTSTNGYLSSTDWNKFNNKVDSIWRVPGVDSIKFKKGTITYSIKDSTGGSGGSSTLSGLTDVNISSPSNLQLLQYQTGDSKWHNFTPNYLAASDTSNKWVNNITRTPGKDSIIFYVGSTRYAIKDSVGTGGGGGGTWGSITGTLSSQTDLQTALDAKEPTITASNTVKKYWNGYKQWVALNSDSLTEGSTNLFYTNARARSALSFTAGSGGYNSSTGVITIPTNTNQLTNGAGFLSSIDTSNISNFSTKVRSLLSASAPLSYNSGTGAFSISQANTSTNGYLSNTDWNTFNNKFTLPSLTSGSVLFSNGTTIAQDNSNLFWDNTNKRLGIKVNNPGYTLQVRGDAYLDSSQLTVNMSNYDKGITVNQWGGGSGYFKINSASSGGMLPTFNAKSTYAGTGIMFIASGYNTYSDGAIVFSGRNAAGTGSITGGTLVDFKNYTTSYLNIDYTGRVGIGVTSPTGVVHIKAGTATAGTAPLKFTAGTNLTTTEAGAVEFDGTHLYFTATNGGTRYQLDQQSGGASALSGLTDVNVSSPSNLQLLQYQTGDSKWHNWTPNYITGNQTITLSGDATGSGATSISTTVGKINGTSLAGLATGILKNTTGTGVPSIAVAGDFPTLNQNTTGSAATLTTTRTIWGQNFNGSANVTGNITLGTSNITMTGSIASTGSRVTKGWFTDLESSNVPTVGGTSLTTLSQTFQNKTLTNSNNVLGGVTMTLGSDANYDIYYRNNSGVLTRLAAGTDGQVLTTHSTTSAPTWTTVSGSTQNLSWNSGTHAVDISGGGTSAVIPLATSSINGLSSSTDKAFLDSLRSHNSYIRNSIAIGDSLLTKKNDSTLIARRLSLTAGDNMTIATTGSNDSLLKYTIDVKNDTTALFTFGAGSGASGDTTAFSTSALYGSFYNAGSDSLIITSINAVMQGSNDTLKISVCFSDTLKAVSPSYVLNSYSINNNSVGKNATSGDFTTAKIPPGKHVYCLSPYVLAGRKPTYLSVTVIGYKKRKL